MGYDENSKQSMFNAGVAQAERIDALQRALNSARFNPQQLNIETETFNYQIMINSLDGLSMESWSKATDKERVAIERIRNLIKKVLIFRPPLIERRNAKRENDYTWNYESYKDLLFLLDLYEKNIKIVLDEHSLNSPNKDDDDEGL